MRRHGLGTYLTLIAVVAIVAVLGGCSSDSGTRPSAGSLSSEGLFLQDGGSALPQGNGNGNGKGNSDGDSVDGPIHPAPRNGVAVLIDGSVGGVVESGRCRLTFTPGAFEGTQRITISDSPSTVVMCNLGPEGLQFSAPVYLEIDLGGTTGTGVTDASIFWYNPSIHGWVDINGTYESGSDAVIATLEHFSKYAPGRAGW